ncbi:calcium-dependent kinase 1 [Micractinium conductrix]|uniref:Calcium-dependent kinase 1 n=1 Tax=Micractinium conductrix TaxID=554055 RepID=A0A2P6VDL3_9CHLO|nr:calcium-dependent kinase 1 [Micractinium conductrix]|eukprot:PSC72167.1 calcium-dependent kinase 1 [Micractinium conductrix]
MATISLGSTTATSPAVGARKYARLTLTVKSAHNLRDEAWLGKSDPYCVVRLACAEIQTHHVKRAGEQCSWNEFFAFQDVSPDDVLEFRVYDRNRILKDAHMDEGSLSLRQVFEEGSMEARVPLITRTGVEEAGELWVSLRKE